MTLARRSPATPVYFTLLFTATSKRTSRQHLGTRCRPPRPAWLPGAVDRPQPEDVPEGPAARRGGTCPLRHAGRGGREGLELHEACTALGRSGEPRLLQGCGRSGHLAVWILML